MESEWYYLEDDYLITTASVNTTKENQNLYFSLERPDNGWPTGDYEVRLYATEDEPVIAKFSVK